jgi:phosphomannomutase
VREHRLKIGVSGIRGVVGEFLTPALAAAFAQAFGTYVGAGKVVVGRDTRPSGEMIEHAVRCGLLAAGCEVVSVGVQPTPTIQVYVEAIGARGALAVTASHNPAEYNALKLFNQRGLFFNHYERGELLDLYHQSDFRHATNEEMRPISFNDADPPRHHLDRVLEHVDVERIRARRFRVALDAVNGAASRMSCEFLASRLNCELHAISVDPSLPFPRVAEPRPDTLGDLAALVGSARCDAGFAQDPDGDRLAIADETGRVLDNDDVLALAVDWALARMDGDVVVNLTTSRAVEDIAARHGRRVYRTPVGEANVVEMMLATGAAIGGEGANGGVIFPSVQMCRDSFSAMAMTLDRMASSGQALSAIAAALPRYFRRSGQFALRRDRLDAIARELESRFPEASADRTDGLKLSAADHWIHVRASNTEPVMRLTVEAAAPALADRVYAEVAALAGLP